MSMEHHSNMQDNGAIIKEVMDAIGAHHYLPLASVCRRWADAQRALQPAFKPRCLRGGTCTAFSVVVASVPLLRFALACGLDMTSVVPNFARACGKYGPREVILWARTRGMPWNAHVCRGVAESGRFDLVRELVLEHRAPLRAGAVARAAAGSGNHLVFLQWMWSMPAGRWTAQDGVCNPAAGSGNMLVLEWMEDEGCLFDESLCTEAARNGEVSALEWLFERGFHCDEWTCQAAACRGDLRTLQWLHSKGVPWVEQLILDGASAAGSIEILEWLRNDLHLGDWSPESMTAMLSTAGMCGHLETAKWLRGQGAPWPDRLWDLDNGGVYGCWKLDTLSWAIGSGCPWGEWPSTVCQDLWRLHSQAEMLWAHAHGCPCECPRDAPPALSSSETRLPEMPIPIAIEAASDT